MARLGLGHPAQDLGPSIVRPLGDQLVDSGGLDLAPPRLQQAPLDLTRRGCSARAASSLRMPAAKQEHVPDQHGEESAEGNRPGEDPLGLG
jgi:hypothetical protein